ncbi:Aryl-alcohol dehydrogenase-like protein [Hapsidospora chrysogenum ATCC 11550]|uniref:Aryl-alcohol dehydrogenase-like protein n=1 Tax=Hapsidospora chrysogenum (strain ATCC 11550 / CBS 779.69 / DSM 880 / IAM 14645 / JCM 23072 / IMI 49137) TaxID=857340 RepID=A0A086T8J2_HAPC1|nr:Aryl-alcohol dehydrogenase-like protein [Hapsidospora chrysogenum ATCC 11550]
MSRTTTALVLTEINGPFELREIELDSLQSDEALVEIHYTGICHTDLSCAKGVLPCAPGAVLGHEGAGVVVSKGSDVTSVSEGDKVLLSFSHCETCPPCLSGHPAYCHDFNLRNFGGKRPDGSSAVVLPGKKPVFSSFFGQSSWARHALVHRSSLVRVPPETELGLLAPLGCGVQTGAGAVLNSLNVREGSSLAVFGVGSVGMSAIMAGKLRGAKTIIAIDVQPARLELAKRLGATHCVVSSKDVVEDIRKICPPVGVDFALDCTGITSVIETMIASLGTKGRASTAGAPGFGSTITVDVMEHLTYGKEYVGCCEGDSLPSEFIPYLIEMHRQGKLPLEELVTFYSVKDYEKALEDSKTGAALKAVMKWDDLALHEKTRVNKL